jgi:general secretion pathway protein G
VTPRAVNALRILAFAGALVPVYCHTACANPIGPYDFLGEPLSLAAILFTILLSFFLEYRILRSMLKGLPAANQALFRRAFIKANLISFPIAWALYLIMGMLGALEFLAGIVLAETSAIVIEKRLYNRWIDLCRVGDRGWQAVIAANFVSWIAGIVIGIMLAFATHTNGPHLHASKIKIAKIQIYEFDSSIQMFDSDTKRLPTTAEGLVALRRNPGNVAGWNGPYLQKDIPLDLWGRAYIYKCPGDHGPFDLYSYGPDGKASTDDDITNWKEQQ